MQFSLHQLFLVSTFRWLKYSWPDEAALVKLFYGPVHPFHTFIFQLHSFKISIRLKEFIMELNQSQIVKETTLVRIVIPNGYTSRYVKSTHGNIAILHARHPFGARHFEDGIP